jgi:hypothetical protein
VAGCSVGRLLGCFVVAAAVRGRGRDADGVGVAGDGGTRSRAAKSGCIENWVTADTRRHARKALLRIWPAVPVVAKIKSSITDMSLEALRITKS